MITRKEPESVFLQKVLKFIPSEHFAWADFCLHCAEKLVTYLGEWKSHSLPEMAISPEGGVQNEEV
jgi:hypothetical protein